MLDRSSRKRAQEGSGQDVVRVVIPEATKNLDARFKPEQISGASRFCFKTADAQKDKSEFCNTFTVISKIRLMRHYLPLVLSPAFRSSHPLDSAGSLIRAMRGPCGLRVIFPPE